MKCGEPGTFGRNAGAEEKIGNTRLHFFGSFVRERDGENVIRGHSLRNEIRHAECDGARFACAGARKNEKRTFSRFGGEALFWIQLFEEREH